MNWEKSKVVIIWLLVALNIYLLFIGNIIKTSYDIKGDQEKNIIELLNKNGVGIYDDINLDYTPLAPINILASESDVDENNYLNAFFTNPIITYDDNSIKATEDSKSIYFENGFVTFVIEDENDYCEFDGGIEDFIKNLDDAYSDFVLDKKFVDGEKTTYEFREMYKGKIIYTNYLSVEVVDNKIASIVGFYGKPVGVTDKPREMASIDMVLYTFMEEAKEIYGDRHIFITDVDLVYYQEEYSSYEVIENTAKAIPCYRIYSDGEEVPFIISAYENDVVN